MICPNCGNENPEDYVFCDECGARLQNTGGMDSAAVVSAPLMPDMAGSVNSGGLVGSTDEGGSGQGQASGGSVDTIAAGSEPDVDSMSDAGAVSDIGNAGDSGSMDPTVGASAGTGSGDGGDMDSQPPLSEYGMPAGGASEGAPVDGMGSGDGQSDQGQADAGADTAQGDTGTGTPSYDYNAWQSTADQSAADQGQAAPDTGSSASASDMGDDDSAAMPVTEDTVGASSDDDKMGAAPAGDDDAGDAADDSSLPGVVPMRIYSDTDYSSAQATSDASMAGASGSTSSGGGEWASAALDYLNQAQQSAGQGDWNGFGEALNNLRTYLQTASQGVQSSFASMGADTSMQSSGMGTDIGSSTMGGSGTIDTMSDTPGEGYTAGPTTIGQASAMSGMSAGSDTSGAGLGADGGSAMPDMYVGAMAGGSAMESMPMGGGSDMDMSGGADADVATLENAAEAGTLPQDVEATPGAETTMARLVMIATGAELPLPEQEEILVGREDPSSGIFPDIDLTPYGGEDGGVSRRHSRLLHIGDDFFVEDLQSTNYTKLDGQRLPAHVRERLEDGARIDFGRVATIFRRS